MYSQNYGGQRLKGSRNGARTLRPSSSQVTQRRKLAPRLALLWSLGAFHNIQVVRQKKGERNGPPYSCWCCSSFVCDADDITAVVSKDGGRAPVPLLPTQYSWKTDVGASATLNPCRDSRCTTFPNPFDQQRSQLSPTGKTYEFLP